MSRSLSTELPNKVFVYGTLMTGYGNHRIISNSSLYIGRGYTTDRYAMINLGSFPGVVPLDNMSQTYQIQGEAYRVSHETLKAMDRLEGHPHFYKREQVEIKLLAYKELDIRETVWMYFFQKNKFYGDLTKNIVPKGDWRQANV